MGEERRKASSSPDFKEFIMNNDLSTKVTKPTSFINIKKSIVAGFGGYILFLVILLLTKTFSAFIQTNSSVSFEQSDFILPIIGFILLSLIKFLENFKDNETV